MDFESAIARLPLWRGSVAIEPLAGGITNVNFKVRDAAGTFVVRAGEDDPRLGIDRDNEVQCARLAARLGVAPEIVYAERPWTVATFVSGRTLDPQALQDHARLRRVARLLRTVHDARSAITGHLRWFSPFLVARTYLDQAHADGVALPFDATAVRRTVDALEARLAPYRPTFCHNDLMPGNLIDDGTRSWLIDWEYAGVGHPWFDVAGLASNAGLDDAATAALGDAYFGSGAVELSHARDQIALLLPMAALRESLWAVVQGPRSKIDFDYGAYRDDNFAKFERGVAALPRDTTGAAP